MRYILAILVLLGSIAGITAWALDSESQSKTDSQAESPDAAAPADPASKQSPKALSPSLSTNSKLPANQTPHATSGILVTPDGQRLPALNGCTGVLEMGWPSQIPYSPIIGKRVSKSGEEYYLHGDGSQTKTVRAYRSDLGRMESQVIVQNPRPVAPYRKPR